MKFLTTKDCGTRSREFEIPSKKRYLNIKKNIKDSCLFTFKEKKNNILIKKK